MKSTTLVLIFLFVQTLSFAQKNNGLILRMLFNGDTKDQSVHKNHGVTKGATTFGEDRFGSKCGAIELNGTDAFITVPTSKSLESPTKEMTIAAWVKINATSGKLKWVTLCCKGNDPKESNTCPQYRLQGTALTVSVNTDFTENLKVNMDFDTWYHYAVTYDGVKVTLYLGSKSVFSFPYSGQFTPNTMPLEIGRDVPGNLEYFNGSLDDLSIYNRALNQSEITALYQDNSEKSSVKPCNIPTKASPMPPPPVVASKSSVKPNIVTVPVSTPVKNTPTVVLVPTQILVTSRTGNPPFVLFQNPYINGKTAPETNNPSSIISAKVLNVTSKKEIDVTLNGDGCPFSFDLNTKLIELKAPLTIGGNYIEIFAKNEYGQKSEFIIINRTDEKPIPATPVKQANAKPTPVVVSIEEAPVVVPTKPVISGNDKIVLKDSVLLNSAQITITCYDHNRIDGDIVTVILNDTVLFDKISLQPKSKRNAETNIQLMPNQEYVLIVKSIDEGTIPTTTLTIEVTATNGFKKVFTLNSKKGTSEALKLVYVQ